MQALLDGSSSDQVLRKSMAVMTGLPGMADAGVGRAAPARKDARQGSELVEDASHLVGALRRYSELMTIPGVLAEEYEHLAQELQVLSDRSAAMLGRLVTLGGETVPEREPDETAATVLPEAVLDCLGLLSKIAGRAVTFFCSPSAYLPVAVSRSAVQRILVNLVKNAVETGPAGDTVAVTLVGMRETGQGTAQLVLTVQGRGRAASPGEAGSSVRVKHLSGRVPDPDVRRGIGFQVVRELSESSGATVEVEGELEAAMSVSVRWTAMDPRRQRRLRRSEYPVEREFMSAGMQETVGAELLVGGEAC